jgi:hypothetical protein
VNNIGLKQKLFMIEKPKTANSENCSACLPEKRQRVKTYLNDDAVILGSILRSKVTIRKAQLSEVFELHPKCC